MMKKMMSLAFLLLLAAHSPLQAADTQETSRRLWSMNQRQAAEQSLRDLTATLSPTGVYPRGFEGILFRSGVDGTDFLTRPYGTMYPGICARDVLTLHYAHVHNDREAADRAAGPVRAYHVSVRQEYAFVRQPPVVMLIDSETEFGSQFRPECADVGPPKTWFSISGADPRVAANGWLLFQNAVRSAHAGTLGPARCETQAERNAAACMELLDSLSDYRLLQGASTDDAGQPHHYYLTLGDYQITMDTTREQNAGITDRVTGISVADRGIALD
jgi:hypothetical protein